MPERARASHEAGLRRFVATGRSRIIGANVEVMGLRRDGAEFPIELSISDGAEPHGLVFTAVIRDRTDRRREEETRFRFLFDSNPLPMYVYARSSIWMAELPPRNSPNRAK